MTNPLIANAAIISASSLLIQNSARQLSTQAQQPPSASLTQAQQYAVIVTFALLAISLLLATFVIIRATIDLFR